MDPQSIISLVQIYGYPLMFILMYIEGPVTTFICSFLASLGIFNIGIVWGLSFLGDFISDVVHFQIGHKGHDFVVNRLEKQGVTYRLIDKLQCLLHRNLFSSLFLIKLSPPPISSAGLFLTGTLKNKKLKAIVYAAIICLIIESVSICLGYFGGSYFYSILKYYNDIAIGLMFVVVIVLFFILKRRVAKVILNEKKC
jgi:membrane protein DedA with SNARE-associated domain